MENTEIIQKARAKAEMWLNDAYDKATRTEVERLLNASDPTELIDSFYNDLEFGTGGLRGIMGVGEQPDEYLYGRCRYPRFRQLY